MFNNLLDMLHLVDRLAVMTYDVLFCSSLAQLRDQAVESRWTPRESKRMLDSVGSSLLKKRWRTADADGRPPSADKRVLDRVGSSLIRKRMLDTVGSSLLKRPMPQNKGSILKKRMLDSIGSSLLKRNDDVTTGSNVQLNKRLLDSGGSSLLLKRQHGGWNDFNVDDLWSKRIWRSSSLDRVGSSLLKRNGPRRGNNADDNISPADNGQWPRQLDEIMDGVIGRDTSTTLNHVKDV